MFRIRWPIWGPAQSPGPHSLSRMQELLDKCHPLGMFDSIATLAVASSMRELYRLVLVDTPLAPYFSESLSAGRQPHRLCISCARVCSLLADVKQGSRQYQHLSCPEDRSFLERTDRLLERTVRLLFTANSLSDCT